MTTDITPEATADDGIPVIDGAPAPSEEEIADFYRANAAAFGRPFAEVLPAVAARAADKKRAAALETRLKELRRSASVTIDRAVLSTFAPSEAR